MSSRSFRLTIEKKKKKSYMLRGQIFQNVFEELQADDSIEGILAFLDNNILIATAIVERLGG